MKKNRKIIVLIAVLIIAAAGYIAISYKKPKKDVPQKPVLFSEEDEKTDVMVYFATSEGSYLDYEKRIIYKSKELENQIKQIILELIQGPVEGELLATIPENVALKEVYLDKNSTVYADFSEELRKNHKGGTTGEMITVYSIVATILKNFTGVKRVQILIEGNQIETLAGHLDLSRPFQLKKEIIKQEEDER